MRNPIAVPAPFTIMQGDVLDCISAIEDETVDCIVTSPPYYRKVDYGHPGQWGMEYQFEDYLQKMSVLMSELYRMLKPTGTCWINIGDSYVNNSSENYTSSHKEREELRRCNLKNMKRGTLLLVPERVMIICQEVGFLVRNKVVWEKNNPKPCGTNRRFQGVYESIIFLTKSMNYYTNEQAIMRPPSRETIERRRRAGVKDIRRLVIEKDIWRLPRKRANIDHPAMFPIEIPMKCISIGCPPGGLVLDPFSGAGTTGEAALKSGCRYIGIELIEEHAENSRKKLTGIAERMEVF